MLCGRREAVGVQVEAEVALSILGDKLPLKPSILYRRITVSERLRRFTRGFGERTERRSSRWAMLDAIARRNGKAIVGR
jgi:hypothetical protein